jgi:hypothetical protein
MKRLHLVMIVTLFLSLIALATSGCSSGTEVNINANTAAPTATVPPTAASTVAPTDAKPATPAAGTASLTGVASCDEYLTQVERCLNNPQVPEAAKAAYRQSLEANRTAWKQAASTPQGKAGLEAGCKAALDGAKGFLASCR